MASELFYTSAARGLRNPAGGYATVAETRGLPAPLARRLEQLGGYRPLPPAAAAVAAAAGGDRPLRAHYRVDAGGRSVSVLTRVGPSGADHSGRPNALAHHVVPGPGELPPAGPAWVLSQPGILAAAWTGEPRLLDPRPLLTSRAVGPAGEEDAAPPAPCRRWAAAAGDAGWAGLVAAAAVAGGRPAYVVVAPGFDPLPLLAEAVALVPPPLRWHATFSTRFDGPPPGAACAIRCVVAGTPAADPAARAAASVVVDLTRLAAAPAGDAADRARAGAFIDRPTG